VEQSLSYPDLQAELPAEIRGDSLWKVTAYRLALFAADIGWTDVQTLARTHITRGLADQLYRALGSIGAIPQQRRTSIHEHETLYEAADDSKWLTTASAPTAEHHS